VHEEEHDQRGFDGGNEERDDRVKGTEIHKSGAAVVTVRISSYRRR
jgi:hypothetical protein